MQMFSSKAHVQLTPFSLEESAFSSNTQLESKHNPTGKKEITDTVEMSDTSDLMMMVLLPLKISKMFNPSSVTSA